MTEPHPNKTPPVPRWLRFLTIGSVALASLAFSVTLWAKWGVILAMSQDFINYCF